MNPPEPDPTAVIEPTDVFSPVELQRARERFSAGDGLHRLLAGIGELELLATDVLPCVA